MKKWLNIISLGNAKHLLPSILWQVLATMIESIPFGFTVLIVFEYIDVIQSGRALNKIYLLGICLGLIITTLFLYLINKKAYTAASDIGCKVEEEAQFSLAGHLKKLSMGFFALHNPGELSNMLVQDSSNLNNMLARLLPKMVSGLSFPIIGVLFLFTIDYRMSLAMLLTMVVSIPLIFLARWLVNQLGRKQSMAMNEATSRMLEYISGIREIKAYNLGGNKFENLNNAFVSLRKACIIQEAFSGSVISLSSIVLHAILPVMMLFGSYYLIAGTISSQVFIIFLIMGMCIGDPLLMAYTFLTELTFYGISAKRIESVLNTSPLPEPEKGDTINSTDICFEKVDFAYNREKGNVIHNISCTMPEHSMTALVGLSGSGKSTITRLIARFWDINGGSIKIGNVPIQNISSDQLIQNIAMVFQDVYLFNDTVLENLAMAKPGATMEEIQEAAKKAACHDFIMNMPNGYNTVIAEGGNTLSGGEKQRISIARAILKDAPIILLDEATASLDPENEIHVQQALSNLVKNKTIVVIAHRLQSIQDAEQILVLKDGEIVQGGNHEQLLKIDGIYQNMWREQSRAKCWKFK